MNTATGLRLQGKYARGRGDALADDAANGDGAWEGSPSHARQHERPRNISSLAGKARGGRSDEPADAAANGDGFWEGSPKVTGQMRRGLGGATTGFIVGTKYVICRISSHT